MDQGMTVTLSTVAGKYGNDLVVSITATQAGSVYLRQGINAAGWAIPPFVIFANELGVAWLKHFNKHTKT